MSSIQKYLLKARVYKALAWTSAFGIVACLAGNVLLSFGYLYEKWTPPSVTLGFGLAIMSGVFMLTLIYFLIAASMEKYNATRGEEFFS